MLVQLVRPLVRTQLQTLANTPAAGEKLMVMVSQWLGYLGVHAEVTQLKPTGEVIEVSLKVARPEQCPESEWRKILSNLTIGRDRPNTVRGIEYASMTPAQQGKIHRLLACVLQASSDDLLADWNSIQPALSKLGLPEELLRGVQSAVRVPTPMSLLVENLEPEVAAYALSKAIEIALLDQHITQAEDDALKTLLNALHHKTTAG